MNKPIILYVDDEKPNLETFVRSFRFDYEIYTAGSGVEALNIIKKLPELALVVADQRMPGMTGIELLKQVQILNPYVQRMILTAFTDNEALLKAIQEGHVCDYVVKPWEREKLKSNMDNAIAGYQERFEKIKQLMAVTAQKEYLEEEIKENQRVAQIIGFDSGLKNIYQQILKVAPVNSTVLIRGETGTGKELIARTIYENSPRRSKPFVRVNCAALPAALLESELFGHEKGAFTGAVSQKEGRFELAHEGTLFLDEIGDLSLDLQVKLLRVLQEKEFERLGGRETIQVDVRLIAATHQPVEKLVREKKFREDLFFRLNVVPIFLPPLRERPEDIESLAQFFVQRYARELGKALQLSHEALQLFQEYDWPGNVRELQNAIERACVLGDSILEASDFSFDLKATVSELQEELVISFKDQIQKEEVQELAQALRKAKGNVSEAARSLNMARSTLVHRLKKYGLI